MNAELGPDERVSKAVAGDMAALSALLRELGPRLRERLSIDSRWQSVLEIDDVLQVTYLEAFLKIGSFTPGGPNAFFGWLKRIAENNLRDAIKALEAAKRPPPAGAMSGLSPFDSGVALLDMLSGGGGTPSRAAAVGEVQSALSRAMESLPPDYAAVVRAYDLEGRHISEVAAAVGRSPGAVHMLRARAHDRLRELLGPQSDFFSQGA